MTNDLLFYGIIVIVTLLGIGAYTQMAKRSRIAAYHELGHGLVAAYYGAQVHSISINALVAGGVTRFGDLTDETKYPSVMVAGYVAESIAMGQYPSGHFNEPQYYHDRAMVMAETKNDITRIDAAIQDAYRILTLPEMQQALTTMVPLLVKRGEISIELNKD